MTCNTPAVAVCCSSDSRSSVNRRVFSIAYGDRGGRDTWGVARFEWGLEIISEASRHLPDELKARHPEIPWPKVAGIGNVLCHEYARVAHDLLWRVVQDDLLPLEKVCREELAQEQEGGP